MSKVVNLFNLKWVHYISDMPDLQIGSYSKSVRYKNDWRLSYNHLFHKETGEIFMKETIIRDLNSHDVFGIDGDYSEVTLINLRVNGYLGGVEYLEKQRELNGCFR